MWETLFNPSMIDSGKEIAIWCPKHDDVSELFAILKEAGIDWWGDSDLLTSDDMWCVNREDTVYYVEYDEDAGKKLAFGGKEDAGNIERGCIFCSERLASSMCVEVGDLL